MKLKFFPKRVDARTLPGRCPLCGHKLEYVHLALGKDRVIMICNNHKPFIRFSALTRKTLAIEWGKLPGIEDSSAAVREKEIIDCDNANDVKKDEILSDNLKDFIREYGPDEMGGENNV